MKKLLVCITLILINLPVCLAQTGVYRAISAGVSVYDDGRERVGGINSTQGVYDCLSRAFGGNGSFISTMLIDFTEQELFDEIEYAFADADENDVSLIYINAHGGSVGGICWIESREGARITAEALEAKLRNIRGKVIVLIDACSSGGYIGNMGQMSDAIGLNSFASDKYSAIVSCAFDENSYRITSGGTDENSVSTVFARAFCEGLGWDLINDRSTALKADTDRDRRVTFYEIYEYVGRRASFYLSASSTSVQSTAAILSDPTFIIASRRMDSN